MMDWGEIARRGEFSMVVVTQARAAVDRIEMHPDAVLIGEVLPSSGEIGTRIGFKSIDDLRDFVESMRPIEVSFRCAPGENILALRSTLIVLH